MFACLCTMGVWQGGKRIVDYIYSADSGTECAHLYSLILHRNEHSAEYSSLGNGNFNLPFCRIFGSPMLPVSFLLGQTEPSDVAFALWICVLMLVLRWGYTLVFEGSSGQSAPSRAQYRYQHLIGASIANEVVVFFVCEVFIYFFLLGVQFVS